jgi:hypothetical protein
MAVSRREKEKQQARRLTAKEWAKKPSLSGGEGSCVRPPEGVELIAKLPLPPGGILRWDFLKYRAGTHNRRADEGFPHFELEYEAHRVPMPSGGRLVLCRRCLDERCAVCDWLVKNGAAADRELVNSLRGKTRHLWVVNDKPGDSKNPFKVFDSNHYNKQKGFGEQMAAAINALDEDEDPFAYQGGSTAVLTVVEDSFPGGKYTLATRIDLKPRRHDYPKDAIERAPCLDDCLVDPGYDEVMALLETGESGRRGEDEDRPARNVKRSAEDQEEEEDQDDGRSEGKGSYRMGDYVTYEGEECEVLKVLPDGNLVLENQDGRKYKDVDPSEVERVPVKGQDDEDVEEEESPAPKARSKSGSPSSKRTTSTDDDEEETAAKKPGRNGKRPAASAPDDDEDEEEEEPDEDPEDDEDLNDEDDEEEEEPVPPPKKKGDKRPSKR